MAQIKDEIKFIENGDETISLSLNEIKIEKLADMDYIFVPSIENSFSKSLTRKVTVHQFMLSYLFYSELCLIDPSIHKYGNVYMLYNKKDKIIKIGKTYDITKRYDKEKLEELVSCIPVNNQSTVESILLKEFKKEHILVDGTKESFYCLNFDKDLRLFKSLTNEHKVKLDIDKSEHIHSFYRNGKYKGRWCSIDVFKILINQFIEQPSIKRKYLNLIESIHKFIDNDSYVYIEHNNMLKTDCVYWKFHKYTVIQNLSDGYVNGSRLWNSIKKVENIKKGRSLKNFLDSEYIQRKKETFERLYPGMPIYTENYKNKSQPQYNGIYVHNLFVHYIADYLNAEYGFLVSALVFKEWSKMKDKRLAEIKIGEYVSRYQHSKIKANGDLKSQYDFYQSLH